MFHEIIFENFPNMGKEIATQVQEEKRVPGMINPRRTTLRHIVIKLTKIRDKEKLLKATREKQKITYKGTSMRLTADFPAETLQVRRNWHAIFKVMKGNQPKSKITLAGKDLIQIRWTHQSLQTSKS